MSSRSVFYKKTIMSDHPIEYSNMVDSELFNRLIEQSYLPESPIFEKSKGKGKEEEEDFVRGPSDPYEDVEISELIRDLIAVVDIEY